MQILALGETSKNGMFFVVFKLLNLILIFKHFLYVRRICWTSLRI